MADMPFREELLGDSSCSDFVPIASCLVDWLGLHHQGFDFVCFISRVARLIVEPNAVPPNDNRHSSMIIDIVLEKLYKKREKEKMKPGFVNEGNLTVPFVSSDWNLMFHLLQVDIIILSRVPLVVGVSLEFFRLTLFCGFLVPVVCNLVFLQILYLFSPLVSLELKDESLIY
ncbi:unnamed protein product [Trifolium pratense]|uniref:Uncharacterized protein n=3 Tax=Trifolium pratense TaxID=57577 RepID=A0ACB0M4D8_TRIPR|nr:unnamed protein product [Trifolium pratense]